MLETTKEKVTRMFSAEALAKFDKAGLTIVDKQDFQVVMDGYDTLANENRTLRLQVKQMTARLSKKE